MLCLLSPPLLFDEIYAPVLMIKYDFFEALLISEGCFTVAHQICHILKLNSLKTSFMKSDVNFALQQREWNKLISFERNLIFSMHCKWIFLYQI